MTIFRKFADLILVRENEYKHVLYFFLIFLIAGCGNAFGRSSTDALFFKRFGIEYLPIMYIVLGVSLSLISIFYAAFADRIKPERFFVTLYILMIGILITNWSVMTFGSTNYIYPIYFVVYEAASEVFLIHAAFYLSQNFDSMQAKRVFPVIMSGTLIGSIIGGTIVSLVSSKIGVHNIIILWCVLLGISISLIAYWHKNNGISPYYRAQYKSSKKFSQAINQLTFGVKLLQSSNLLKFSSIALFFMVITFYVLCYSVNRVYTTTFTTEEELTSFFGKLTAITSFLALTMQIFLTNKVINRFGAKNVNLFFPITSLVSYIGLLTSFSLTSALAGSINKDAIMPAFRNPVRAIFFNAIPENIRGRALAIQIVIVIPLALAVCGSLLLFMQKMGDPIYFLAIGLVAALFYLFYNHKMNNAYLSEILSNLKQRIHIPNGDDSSTASKINMDDFVKKIDRLDDKSLISFVKILFKSNPSVATDVILNKTSDACPAIKDQIISIVRTVNPTGFSQYLWKSYENADNHLKFTILTTLFKINDPEAEKLIPKLLDDQNLRIKTAGIVGAISTNNDNLTNIAINEWLKIIKSNSMIEYYISLKLIPYLNKDNVKFKPVIDSYRNKIIKNCQSNELRLLKETVVALEYWPEDKFNEILPILENAYKDECNDNRINCIRRCSLLINPIDNNIIKQALEDSSSVVCYEAAKLLYVNTPDPVKQFFYWLTNKCVGSPRYQEALIKVLLKNNVEHDYFEEIAYVKSREALELNEILRILSCAEKSSSSTQITIYAVEERIQEYIDLTLLAMQALEHPDDIYIIREGLKSKDSRHIANANEVITHFKNKRISETLSTLIDKSNYKVTTCMLGSKIKDVSHALIWCANHNDPWISYCAKNHNTGISNYG